MPSISAIIPSYNRAALLPQTLRCLLGQSLPADEIIVVDDGSTDSTVEAAEAEFHRWKSESRVLETARGEAEGNVGTWEGGKLPEFKVIRQENAGPGAARNRGFAESKGEFIHFFDSDDIAAPNKHEVQVRALQETGADIAYGPWVKGRITEHGAGPLACSADGSEKSGEQGGEGKRYGFEPEGFVFQQKGLPQGDLTKELLTRWSIVPQACLFRRSIVEKSGGFPNDIFVGEDQLMFLRCLLLGAKVVHTPEALTFYRLGDYGKLTESPEGATRRTIGWSEFLIQGAEMASAASPDSTNSWRFRKRCWGAIEDCRSLQPPATGQIDRLSKLAKAEWVSSCFKAHDTLSRWAGGIRQRVTGDRQDRSFMTGPMTDQQRRLFPGN
jgi:glycosyltransferase involved in cell wall biosynthesis